MNEPTTGEYATSSLPPSPVVEKAIAKCFDAYFSSGEWVGMMSDHDRSDLLRRLWELSKAKIDEDGAAYTPENREIDMRALLDRQAYLVCEARAQCDWMMFV